MTRRRVKARRVSRRPKAAEEEEVQEVLEVEEDDEEEVLEGEFVDDDDDGTPDPEPEEVEEEKPAPKPRKASPKKEEKSENIEIKSVRDYIVDDLLDQMFLQLEEGKALVITRISGKQWKLETLEAAQVNRTPKLKGKAYWDEVTNPEWAEAHATWASFDDEEKVEYCKSHKITWEHHDSPKIDAMRMTEAYRDYLGLDKYKPEYATRAARSAIRA